MYDLNEDGKLSAGEAKDYIVDWCKEELGILRPRESMVQRTFNEMDKNKNKYIEKDELFEHLKQA